MNEIDLGYVISVWILTVDDRIFSHHCQIDGWNIISNSPAQNEDEIQIAENVSQLGEQLFSNKQLATPFENL